MLILFLLEVKQFKSWRSRDKLANTGELQECVHMKVKTLEIREMNITRNREIKGDKCGADEQGSQVENTWMAHVQGDIHMLNFSGYHFIDPFLHVEWATIIAITFETKPHDLSCSLSTQEFIHAPVVFHDWFGALHVETQKSPPARQQGCSNGFLDRKEPKDVILSSPAAFLSFPLSSIASFFCNPSLSMMKNHCPRKISKSDEFNLKLWFLRILCKFIKFDFEIKVSVR